MLCILSKPLSVQQAHGMPTRTATALDSVQTCKSEFQAGTSIARTIASPASTASLLDPSVKPWAVLDGRGCKRHAVKPSWPRYEYRQGITSDEPYQDGRCKSEVPRYLSANGASLNPSSDALTLDPRHLSSPGARALSRLITTMSMPPSAAFDTPVAAVSIWVRWR
jgi:hypothetical protein